MSEVIGMLPTIGKVGAGASGIMGVISNIIRGNRVNSAQKAAIAQQKNLQGLLNNPAQLAQKVASMEQPLNQGLVAGVENAAQGGLAERGLGTSPQIANEVFAQALGPYEQQNRQAALSAILQSYGMSQDAINSIIANEGQPIDTSGLWGSMQKKPNIPTLPSQTPNYPPSPDQPGGGITWPSNNPPSSGDPSNPPVSSDIPGAPSGFPGSDDLWGGLF